MTGRRIGDIIRKMQGSWFEDGAWEIAFGLAMTLASVWNWLDVWQGLSRRWGAKATVAYLAVLAVAFALMRPIVGAVKERWTFPRTGYVAYRRRAPRALLQRLLVAVMAAAVMSGLVTVLTLSASAEVVVPMVAGCAVAGTMSYAAARFGMPRFLVIAGAALAAGAAMAILGPGTMIGVAAILSATGLSSVATGAVTLCRFIRTAELADPERMG